MYLVSESVRIMIFKIAILLSQLGSLMRCTHDVTVLSKTKEMIRYCESFGYDGKNTLTNVSNDLTRTSVPVEDGSQQSTTFTHALWGSSTFVPTHALVNWYFRAHFNVLQAKHKHQNLHKQQNKTFTALIVLLKPQTIK
jgi:hypothetical protein